MTAEIRGVPSELTGFAADTWAPTLSLSTFRYSGAVYAYNNATPNSLRCPGLANHADAIDGTERRLLAVRDVVGDFGWALDELDRTSVDLTGPHPVVVHVADDEGLVAALAAARDRLPFREPARSQAIRTTTADYYVDRLDAWTGEDGYPADVGDAPSADQLATVLAQLESRVADDELLAAAVVDRLGNDRLNSLVHMIDDLAWQEGYEVPIEDWRIREDVLDPLARIVAASTHERPAADVATTIDELHPSVLALLAAASPWEGEAADGAFDRLREYRDFVPTAMNGRLHYDVYGADYGVAAMIALTPHPARVFARFDADPDLLDDHVFGHFEDSNGGIGRDSVQAFLLAGLVTHPLTEAANGNTVPLERQEALLQDIVRDPGGMNHGARRALAEVAALHASDIAEVAQFGDGWGEVSRSDLVDFYDELFESVQAQQIAARGLGAFIALEMHHGAALVDESGELHDFHSNSRNAGELSDLFTDALEQDNARDVERANFWIGVGRTVGIAAAGAGIAAAPLTAGQSLAAGTGARLGIGWLTDQISVPGFDNEAAGMDAENTIEVAAAVAVVRYDLHTEADFADVPADMLADLQSPDFQDRLLAGDAAAIDRLREIRRAVPQFDSDVLAASGQATLALAEP